MVTGAVRVLKENNVKIPEEMASDEVGFLAREKLKIRPEGGKNISRPLAETKESFSKKRSGERIISLVGTFRGRRDIENYITSRKEPINKKEEMRL